jgi:glyoxylase-like metal-dependent hydrolase (beta-lactamase superfamily II)
MPDPKSAPNSAADALPERFLQITIPVGMLQCNCTIIGDPKTKEALVIDPGDEVGRILELLGRHQLKVKAIVSTHAHIDHVGGLSKLHQYTGAPVMMHRDDLSLYQNMDIQANFLGVAMPEVGEIDQFLTDGDVLQWGSLALQVMHTPGHSPGSVSLYLPPEAGKVTAPTHASEKTGAQKPSATAPQLFAGDTLFAGSIGRTDLWGGSMDQIMDSLNGKVMQLPEETIVHPGHGARTTIGEERQSNPFFKK